MENEITEEMKNHADMVEKFETGIFNIVFEKADGSLREMRCTRDAEHIPVDLNELTKPVVVVEGKKPRKANYTALRVFELGDVNQWRSFKIENLKECILEVEEYDVKLFKMWFGWDIGQNHIIFKSVESAKEWFNNNGDVLRAADTLKPISYDDSLTPYQNYLNDGLVGIEQVVLVS